MIIQPFLCKLQYILFKCHSLSDNTSISHINIYNNRIEQLKDKTGNIKVNVTSVGELVED